MPSQTHYNHSPPCQQMDTVINKTSAISHHEDKCQASLSTRKAHLHDTACKLLCSKVCWDFFCAMCLISLVDEVFLLLARHSNRRVKQRSHDNMQKMILTWLMQRERLKHRWCLMSRTPSNFDRVLLATCVFLLVRRTHDFKKHVFAIVLCWFGKIVVFPRRQCDDFDWNPQVELAGFRGGSFPL